MVILDIIFMMDDKSKQTISRKYLIYFALSTRLAIITIQCISNILIIDHNPDVFTSPKEPAKLTLFSKITNTFLGGLLHWDGQYFYHIAKYGYTYENTLPFFPLFPMLTAIVTIPFSYILPFLEWDAIVLILFVILNIFFFVNSALALFDLSMIILNRKLAFRATFLFCINPASIFFVAPYSECFYSYFTFTTMLKCAEIYYNNTKNKAFTSFTSLLTITIPIALSISTRSNGILNIGFLLYFWLSFFRKSYYWPHNISTLIDLLKGCFLLIINVVICVIPFIAFQVYAYIQFCTNFQHNLPKILVQYADTNKYVLPGTFLKHNQTWCFKNFQIAYYSAQEHYWNVGFLRYYEFKQIPNFLLALPLVFIIIRKSFLFMKQHKNYCLNLGLFEFGQKDESTKDESSSNILYDQKMFVFVFHAFLLTVFCVLCIHVQVTTRVLCSGSPVLYWFCAYAFENVRSVEFDLFSSWKGFIYNNKLNSEEKFIKFYFLSYFIIGTIMFSNNFPYT